ncbi:MAG: ABC transporter permease [Janthinobacterium lividum]
MSGLIRASDLAHKRAAWLRHDPDPSRASGLSGLARLSRRARALARRPMLLTAWLLLTVLIGCALFAPWLAPYQRDAIDLSSTLGAPSAQHWFGADQLGRDVLTRVIWGARSSLSLAALAVICGGTVGCGLGIFAGYRRGWPDALVMRICDMQYSLPSVIIAMVATVALGSGTVNLVFALVLATWPRFARVLRAETLSLRSRDFVLLAELSGASVWRVMWRHLLPNLLGTIIVLATLDVGLVIMLEATLSFLGIGIQPPTPAWGGMIADGRGYLDQAWWLSFFPGGALLLTVLAVNTAGDALLLRFTGQTRAPR